MRPQAWCTPIGLLAVIGPSMKLKRRSDVVVAREVARHRVALAPALDHLALERGHVQLAVDTGLNNSLHCS